MPIVMISRFFAKASRENQHPDFFLRIDYTRSRSIAVPAKITRGGCVQRIRSKPEGWFMYRRARYPMI